MGSHLSTVAVSILLACFSVPGSVSACENLVCNGSFEEVVNGQPANWTLQGDASVHQMLSTDAGVTSGRSARLECTAFKRTTRNGYATLVQKGALRLEEGKWYQFSCWARQEHMANSMVSVEILANLSDPFPSSTTVLSMQLPLAREWREFDMTFRATQAGSPNSLLTFYFDFPGVFWVDDVRVVEIPTPLVEFTDVIPALGSRNLVMNGSLECGPDGWLSLGTRTSFAGGLSGLYGEIVDGGARGGRSLCVKIGPDETPVSTFGFFEIAQVPQRAPLAVSLGWMEADKGRPYTLSAYMRADRPGVPARLVLRFAQPLGILDRYWVNGFRGIERSNSVTLSTEWARYTLTVPADERYAYVAIGPDMTQSEGPATVWIDGIQLESGQAATEFEPREPVEVGFSTCRYGNVFDVGDPVRLDVWASNDTSVDAAIPIHLEIEDYFGQPVWSSARTLMTPANGRASLQWPLDLPQQGFFTAKVSWEANGRRHAKALRFAVIEPYKQSDSIFGIDMAPATDQGCHALKKAGLVWAREWATNWQHVEPELGVFEFALADAHIKRVRNTGMQILEVVPHPSSNWASSAPVEAEAIGAKINSWWWRMMYPPKDKEALVRFVQTLVSHYRGQIRFWEYLNEPFYTVFSLPNTNQTDVAINELPGANFTVPDYVSLLKTFYETSKAADPGARVVGGLCGRPDLLTDEFFEAGGLDYVDIFNLHIYPGLRKPEAYIGQMKELLRNMEARAGTRKPIWVTECAYFARETAPWTPFIFGPAQWADVRSVRDERQCADYTVRFDVIMLAHGVQRIFYESGIPVSCEANDDLEDIWSALLFPGGVPKKLYVAQTVLASMLGSRPEYAGSLPDTCEGTDSDSQPAYGYAFQCGNRAVLVAWAPEDAQSPEAGCVITIPKKAQGYTIVGTPILERDLRLGETPVYVVSDRLAAKQLLEACRLRFPGVRPY